MSLVKAYHAGELDEIDDFIKQGFGILHSSQQGNWLGEGMYFWENDPERAEEWQIRSNKGAILECEIDTRSLLNLVVRSEHTIEFYDRAKQLVEDLTKTSNLRNHRDVQKFDLDNQIFRQTPTILSGGQRPVRYTHGVFPGRIDYSRWQSLRKPAYPDLPLGCHRHPKPA